jgi:hypothetical protein
MPDETPERVASPTPETTGRHDQESFDKGVSVGLMGARVIAQRMGATDVASALRDEHDTWFPRAEDGEAEARGDRA